jgi:DNA polymerase III epsilon subunit-like protein|uniref:Exonuclease domain-containing protein n=1 Tax=viral metagenome TaxID=1070528 RepID=A0A6C0EHQ9_9ZZZZ
MDKIICFLYTETTGLHKTNDQITKKNLYCYARMVTLNYEIGYIENNVFILSKKVKNIIKPRSMHISEDSIKFHNITQEYAIQNGKEIELVIEEFKNDNKNTTIIVSHNIDFHLKTLISEAFRYNIVLEFNNYLIIDTISFFHKYGFIKLKDLFDKLKIEKNNDEEYDNTELIKLVFFKLYSKFKKSIKKDKK